jgi:ATP-dependent Clp protease ATP-binding subunit ClpA
MDFTLKDRIESNKIKLADEIHSKLKACPLSLFIFDEVEKMPPGIFDAITSFLDYHGTVKGVDISKSIFIFVGNSAGKEIAITYQNIIKTHGLYREETKLHHFEEIAKIGAYNFNGGLQNSNTIIQSLIDHYLPFLPLERRHIEDCIREEFIKVGQNHVGKEVIDNIISRFVAFDRSNLFALNGCKQLEKKVEMEAEDLIRDLYSKNEEL